MSFASRLRSAESKSCRTAIGPPVFSKLSWFALCLSLAVNANVEAQEEVSWSEKRWRVLFPTTASATPLTPIPDYRLQGPYEDSPLFLSKFATDTNWDVKDRMLQVPSGRNAVLKLGRAENFVLEGEADLTGPGGMFFILGENDEHGYGLAATTMVKSGCPWQLFEFRGREAIDDSMVELAKYEPLRPEPFRLSVADHRLSLTIGRIEVFKEVPLANYHEGDILIGVYDTRYGPKRVKIKTMRAKALPAVARPNAE